MAGLCSAPKKFIFPKFITGCLRLPWTPTYYIFCQLEPNSEQKQVCQGKILMVNYSKMLLAFFFFLFFLLLHRHTTRHVEVKRQKAILCKSCCYCCWEFYSKLQRSREGSHSYQMKNTKHTNTPNEEQMEKTTVLPLSNHNKSREERALKTMVIILAKRTQVNLPHHLKFKVQQCKVSLKNRRKRM